MLHTEKIGRAIGYCRLSKEDGGRHESDSIGNQRKLIQEYAATHDDVELIDIKDDDGYTGTNYDRPGFCAVMKAIEDGRADCVIVKDLSRLGREYIETGKYLEMVFPEKGVRFIAINDDVDSDRRNQSDDIIIPVKNLMNESYCRDLSKKLRAQFRLQRRNGEFLGAFASYGYRKSPDDKHKLIIDEYAATIVRSIFSFKMQGYSQQAIADCLNQMGELPPSEYKKQDGLRYRSGFKSSGEAKWSAVTVRGILTNPLYTGELVQGKRGTPNYKIKKMRQRKPEEWVAVKNNHVPIVDELMFSVVQKMLQRDTRTPPEAETVQHLAGVLFCPDCGRAMCRRVVTRCGKKFYYYVCSTHKRGAGCSSHTFPQEKLEAAVLHAIQNQVRIVVEMEELMRQVSSGDLLAVKLKRADLLIEKKRQEIAHYEAFRMKLFEAKADGLIDREEYGQMWEKYTRQIQTAQAALKELERRRDGLESESAPDRAWMEQFLKYRNITALSREVVVTLVDQIYVYEDRRLRINFNFRDELAEVLALLSGARKEAV